MTFIWNRVGPAIVVGCLAGAFVGPVAAWYGLLPVALAGLAGLLVTLGVGFVVAHSLLGRPGRRIAEAALWYSEHEGRHWRERTGTRLPRTMAGARRWLAQNPATDSNRSERIQAWLLVGEHEAAREEQRMRPVESAADRVDATLDEWLIDLWVGSPAPVETGHGLVNEAMDEPRRARVKREVLMLRTMDSAIRGDPWQPRMLELRDSIGVSADGYLWRRFWPLVAAWATLAYVIGAGIGWLVTGGPE